MVRAVAVAAAAVTLGVVAILVWGAWSRGDATSVGDLPTVEEVVAAQAHRHGIELPELQDDDRVRLTAPPSDASSLSPYEQVLSQLTAVKQAAGVEEAIAILGEVALQSDAVAADCQRLYEALTADGPAQRTLQATCPA